MGSNTPPGSSVTLTPAATSSTSATNVDQNNAEQLRRLLEQKEQEIRSLKFELEKYKLALRQAQADNKQRVLFTTGGPSTDEGKAGDVRRLEEQDDEDDDDDLGEIDLHVGAGTASDIDEGEKISASGLTFTDAAISNLNQLAALQERCESQQHSHSQQQQQQPPPTSAAGTTATAAVPPPIELVTQTSSSSVSPNSTIHQADLNSNQSLANVVAAAAAAAVAAAAESDNHLHHHHQQQHHDPTHQLQQQPQSTDPTRSISSALSSPEFFQNLHHQHHLNQHQQQRQQAHQTGMHQQSMSPLTSLHFSPSTSITQSPSSLLAQARRSNSNTSTCSGFMSPISSPNYLRRQFMPDRLPMMSPSPSSLTTGSSSAASTSLAHILQQQVYQQRSVSALAGPITSPSSTPLSSTGSNAVSPLIGSKNSSQVRLNNMQIRHKFGYLGSSRGQFNSPHGFCLGLNQEIVVADTNNHRVCIFDKSGTYLTQFGSPGKEEGQLWNPRKVAILHRPSSGGVTSGVSSSSSAAATNLHRNSISSYSSHFTNAGGIQSITTPGSGAIVSGSSLATTAQGGGGGGGGGGFASEPLYVVCDRGAERSRMQLFTKDGSFIKKIAIHYIDIVAGLAITQNGLIIVVDSVSPTVYIINAETGTLNGWFDCSGHMKEPSDIAVKSDLPGNEYFICDFKGHCVVVFSEHGDYLRRIGHDGLTSYPNGIDISDDGDILVGDSHGNRFHVVVFDRNGLFVSQFECPHVKVSRCCGLKITREGYIVTLAKNNHHVLVLDTIHI